MKAVVVMALVCFLAACAPDLGFDRAGSTDGGRHSVDGGPLDGSLADGGAPDGATTDDGGPGFDGASDAALDGGADDCPAPQLLVLVATTEASEVPGHVARLSLANEGAPTVCSPLTGSGALMPGATTLTSPTPSQVVVARATDVQGIDATTDTVVWADRTRPGLGNARDGFVVEDPVSGDLLTGVAWVTSAVAESFEQVAVYDRDGARRRTWVARELPAVLLSLTQHTTDPSMAYAITTTTRVAEIDLFNTIVASNEDYRHPHRSIYAIHDGTRSRMVGTDAAIARHWIEDEDGDPYFVSTTGGDCGLCRHRLHGVPDPRDEEANFILCSSTAENGPSFVVHNRAGECELVYRSATVALDARAVRMAISPPWI